MPATTTTAFVTIAIDTATSRLAAFREAASLILLTPASGNNNDVALRVPYFAVRLTSSSSEIAGAIALRSREGCVVGGERWG